MRLKLDLVPTSAFSYECHGCGKCCFDKAISVNPFEVLLIARELGRSTGDVLARFVDEATRTLARREDGSCSLLEKGRCTVHGGRPAACRIYPLAMVEQGPGEPRFARLDGHPASAGEWGERGTVEGYLSAQGLDRFASPYAGYRAIFSRLVAIVSRAETHCEDLPELDVRWFDVDAAPEAAGAPTEEAVGLHLEHLDRAIGVLERWLDTREAATEDPQSRDGTNQS